MKPFLVPSFSDSYLTPSSNCTMSKTNHLPCYLAQYQWLTIVMVLSLLVNRASGLTIAEHVHQGKLPSQNLFSPFHHMRTLMSIQEPENRCTNDIELRSECERCSKLTRSTQAFMECCRSGQMSYCKNLMKDSSGNPDSPAKDTTLFRKQNVKNRAFKGSSWSNFSVNRKHTLRILLQEMFGILHHSAFPGF